MCAVSDCLPHNALPDVLQQAARRLPRKSPRAAKAGTRDARRGRPTPTQNHANNYLAEASAMRREGQTSPLGGRNRQGAGAPTGNRNARGARALRLHMHLKKRLLADRLQLLVLSAAVSHLERRLAPTQIGPRFAAPTQNFAKQLSCRSFSYAPPQERG